jgi:hypothetical protein
MDFVTFMWNEVLLGIMQNNRALLAWRTWFCTVLRPAASLMLVAVHRIPLAPIISALDPTLTSAVSVHNLQQSIGSAYSHINFSISELSNSNTIISTRKNCTTYFFFWIKNTKCIIIKKKSTWQFIERLETKFMFFFAFFEFFGLQTIKNG